MSSSQIKLKFHFKFIVSFLQIKEKMTVGAQLIFAHGNYCGNWVYLLNCCFTETLKLADTALNIKITSEKMLFVVLGLIGREVLGFSDTRPTPLLVSGLRKLWCYK